MAHDAHNRNHGVEDVHHHDEQVNREPGLPDHSHWGDKELERPSPWIWVVLVGIFLSIAVTGGVRGIVAWWYTPSPTAQTQAAQQAATVAHAVPQAPQTVGKELTTYRFGPDGCVEKYLRGDWRSYAKGGGIRFISIETGQTVKHQDLKHDTSSSIRAGNYRICKEDPDAWGVEIFE